MLVPNCLCVNKQIGVGDLFPFHHRVVPSNNQEVKKRKGEEQEMRIDLMAGEKQFGKEVK
jgi:hypothetical protein